jgi:hypothetical protein
VNKELNRYTGEDRELMKRALLNGFVGAIDLDGNVSLDLVLRGIEALSGKEEAANSVNAIKQLYNECSKTREAEKQRADDAGRQMLRDMGISGNAICAVNIYARDEWLNAMNGITAYFEKQLKDIKKNILK